MDVSLQIPSFTWPGGPEAIGPTLRSVATTAEEAGFDTIWVMDHFFQLPMLGPLDEPMLEGYSTLGYLAGVTSRVRLGTLVTGAIYRHPAVLAKAVTTLDVVSGGRAWLGIGAGWFEPEARGLGIPFPSVSERFSRLEETLQLVTRMWRGDRSPFTGAHHEFAEPILSPIPVTKPHPPILVGGGGERKTLRLVAEFGDACNLFAAIGEEELQRKLDALRTHCDDVGRADADIEKTVYVTHRGDADATADTCAAMAKLGFTHAIFYVPEVHEPTRLDDFVNRVLPRVRDL